MRYQDVVYGEVEISDPVLLDLIDSPPLARLRGIYQAGITALLGIAPDFSRFDHSLGVCLLLRRLGAPLIEQIAGLLHDLSHTAFSHVVDFVYHQTDQTYHEQIFERILSASVIPEVLAGHGYDWRIFLEETAFPLLEQPLPRLCADRLDYFLRDALGLGLATPAQVGQILACLAVRQGRIALPVASRSAKELAPARWLGETFMAADHACWSDLRELSLYWLTGDALRAALKSGCVADDDLLSTDRLLWEKLRACPEPAVRQRVALISPQTGFVVDGEHPDFLLKPKVRAIDPDVWLDSRLQPLSELDPEFAAVRSAYLVKDRPWPVRIITRSNPSTRFA